MCNCRTGHEHLSSKYPIHPSYYIHILQRSILNTHGLCLTHWNNLRRLFLTWCSIRRGVIGDCFWEWSGRLLCLSHLSARECWACPCNGILRNLRNYGDIRGASCCWSMPNSSPTSPAMRSIPCATAGNYLLLPAHFLLSLPIHRLLTDGINGARVCMVLLSSSSESSRSLSSRGRRCSLSCMAANSNRWRGSRETLVVSLAYVRVRQDTRVG